MYNDIQYNRNTINTDFVLMKGYFIIEAHFRHDYEKLSFYYGMLVHKYEKISHYYEMVSQLLDFF